MLRNQRNNRHLKTSILKTHFLLLLLLLLNQLAKHSLGISLNVYLATFLVWCIYLSAIVLFIGYVKPFKKRALYFSMYLWLPVSSLFFWLFGGFFFSILCSIFLYQIQPPKEVLKNEQVTVSESFAGFLGSCCFYQATEKKWLILERQVGEFHIMGGFDPTKSSLATTNGTTKLTFEYEAFDDQKEQFVAFDSTIVIGKN